MCGDRVWGVGFGIYWAAVKEFIFNYHCGKPCYSTYNIYPRDGDANYCNFLKASHFRAEGLGGWGLGEFRFKQCPPPYKSEYDGDVFGSKPQLRCSKLGRYLVWSHGGVVWGSSLAKSSDS